MQAGAAGLRACELEDLHLKYLRKKSRKYAMRLAPMPALLAIPKGRAGPIQRAHRQSDKTILQMVLRR